MKRLETHAGLLRLDQLLQQLCDLENELTGLLQGPELTSKYPASRKANQQNSR